MKRKLILALLAIGVLGAVAICTAPDAAMRAASGFGELAHADSMGPRPTNVFRIKTQEPVDLDESSALVFSDAQGDIVFTINDSGNEAELFALDTAGTTRGRWKVEDAKNRDWEAASLGPCIGSPVATDFPGSCIFVADVGDNSAMRKVLALYQLGEPRVGKESVDSTISSRVIHFRYPDDSHDVESMYMGPDGTAYFITKRALKNSDRQLRRALVFAVPASAWLSADTVIASLVDSLPIVPGSADKRQVTDASLSRDGRYLAVRTYGQIFTFAADSVTGRVRHEVAPALCNIVQTEARHGEGVTWFGRTRELLLSNEGRNAPLHRITCPLP